MRDTGGNRISSSWAAVAVIAAVMILVTGCGSSSTASSGKLAKSNYRIAVVLGQATDPFFVTEAKGATDEAQKDGATVNWQAPQQFDPSQQIPILQSVLASKPQLLIVHLTDKTALVPIMQQYKQAKIPVILLGGPDLADTSLRLGFLASNNVAGGSQEADALTQAVGSSGGKVLLITCPPGTPCGNDRRNGFETEIGKNSSFTYVGAQLYNGDESDAARIMSAELKRYPDLVGVACSDGTSGIGAATAINEAGMSGKVKVVSFDAGPDLVAAMKKGWVSDLMIQQSYTLGSTAVQFGIKYLNGGFTVPDSTRFPLIVGNATNIDSPDIAKYLYG